MKQSHYEILRRKQLEYHRYHPWGLSERGLHIPYSFEDLRPGASSTWDDVGFILNGRRIIVWWQHPRLIYSNAINKKAWEEVGDGPRDNWLTEGGTKTYRKVGRSRKKLVCYTSREPSPEQRKHYDLLNATMVRLRAEGIDCDVSASWKWQRLNWAMGVSLVAPIDVRSANDLADVADLAKRLILWKTTLQKEFPEFNYGRANWLRERAALADSE